MHTRSASHGHIPQGARSHAGCWGTALEPKQIRSKPQRAQSKGEGGKDQPGWELRGQGATRQGGQGSPLQLQPEGGQSVFAGTILKLEDGESGAREVG